MPVKQRVSKGVRRRIRECMQSGWTKTCNGREGSLGRAGKAPIWLKKTLKWTLFTSH
jgi:hypothetical protein